MFLRHNLPAMLWALAILILCALPGDQIPESPVSGFDKAVHWFLYLVFIQLMIVGFKKQITFKRLKYHAITIAVTIGIFYGILTELIQGMIFVSRTMEISDMLANSVGSLSGVLSFFIVYGNPKT